MKDREWIWDKAGGIPSLQVWEGWWHSQTTTAGLGSLTRAGELPVLDPPLYPVGEQGENPPANRGGGTGARGAAKSNRRESASSELMNILVPGC